MTQWNPIGVLLLYARNNILRNALESSLILLETKFIQLFPYSASLLWLQLPNLTCQDLHHIRFFPCRHPRMVSLDPRKVWSLIKFLIYFNFSFNQDFLTSAGNLAISTKLLGSGMKSDTSNPDSPKLGNQLFN